MKKLLIIILFTGFSIHSQTPTSTMKGYYLQKIGDSVVGQNTRADKAFFDLYNYMVKRKIKKGTVTGPYWEIDIDYPPDLPPQIIRDTIYFSSGHISIGNQWMGEPITETIVLRINAGGSEIQDQPLNWLSDVSVSKFTKTGNNKSSYTTKVIRGNTIPTNISDEVFKTIFKTESWNGSTPLTYAIPLENGWYNVDFFLVSQYSNTTSIGSRIFKFKVEDYISPQIDLTQRFGVLTAGVITYEIKVSDGVLNIGFDNIVERGLVNAIQIRK